MTMVIPMAYHGIPTASYGPNCCRASTLRLRPLFNELLIARGDGKKEGQRSGSECTWVSQRHPEKGAIKSNGGLKRQGILAAR